MVTVFPFMFLFLFLRLQTCWRKLAWNGIISLIAAKFPRLFRRIHCASALFSLC